MKKLTWQVFCSYEDRPGFIVLPPANSEEGIACQVEFRFQQEAGKTT